MFSLHETTRIHVCRAAFVALCLVPTAALVVWCLWIRGGGYRQSHERAICEQLGWQARLEGVSLPRPGVVLYEGLQLSDPESGQLLAQVPFAEISTSGTATTIRLPFPATVNGLRLDALAAAAERQLRAGIDPGALRFEAQHVTLHLAEGDQTLSDVEGRLAGDSLEARLEIKFRLAAAGAAPSQQPTAELTAVRHRESPPRTAWQFTSGSPLPLTLIASTWPAASRLGKAVTFDGRAAASRHAGLWKLELNGRLNQIDLEQLVEPFPHKLTGPASVELAQATVENGRLLSAAGKLSAGPGTLSRSLVHSAQASLQLEAAPVAMSGRDNHLAYRQLALAFEIDSQGLALTGDVADAHGAVLVGETQVLLRQTKVARLPVVNLLRTLVPQTAVQVPATRQTGGLAQFLPVPQAVPVPGSEGALPQARELRVTPR